MSITPAPEIISPLESPKSKAFSTNKIAGDTLLTGIAFALALTVGQRAIGFIRGVIFGRLMTDQELGQWSMAWGFLMLIPPLAMLGLTGCFGKFTEHFRQRESLRQFVRRIGAVNLISLTIVISLLLLLPNRFAPYLFRGPQDGGLVVCLAISLIAVAGFNFTTSLLESLRLVRLVSWIRFITAVSFAVIGCWAIGYFENSANAAVLAFGFCNLLGLVPAIWLVWHHWQLIRSPDPQQLRQEAMWKKILPFAGWMWASNFLINSIEIADRYMLLQLSNASVDWAQGQVGQYHSSRMLPLLMNSLAVMVAGILFPYLSQLWESNRRRDAARQLNLTYKLTGLSFIFGSAIALAAAPFFFDVLMGGKYQDGLRIFPMTMVLFIWFSLTTVGQDYLWVAERGRLVSLALIGCLLTNIGLNWYLIPIWGLDGAVTATAISNLILIATILLMNQFNDCHNDFGMWLILLLPLLLLLPTWLSVALMVPLGLTAYYTRLIFSKDEKRLILSAIQNRLRHQG